MNHPWSIFTIKKLTKMQTIIFYHVLFIIYKKDFWYKLKRKNLHGKDVAASVGKDRWSTRRLKTVWLWRICPCYVKSIWSLLDEDNSCLVYSSSKKSLKFRVKKINNVFIFFLLQKRIPRYFLFASVTYWNFENTKTLVLFKKRK